MIETIELCEHGQRDRHLTRELPTAVSNESWCPGGRNTDSCPRCGHALKVHPDGVCRVALNELPSCTECRANLDGLVYEGTREMMNRGNLRYHDPDGGSRPVTDAELLQLLLLQPCHICGVRKGQHEDICSAAGETPREGILVLPGWYWIDGVEYNEGLIGAYIVSASMLEEG